MSIIKITDQHREALRTLFESTWGSCLMVSRGAVHRLDKLPGFIFYEDEMIKGIITYHLAGKQCEIVSLDSFSENRGIGSSLLNALIELANKEKWQLWLITTNDNTRALHFYQKRGFRLSNIYWNAVDAARKIKPEIPVMSSDGIPIQHEIELVYQKDERG